MNGKWQGFDISHFYSLWQDLSMDTNIFDLVTLTLEIDLLLENNFNFGYISSTIRAGAI